VLLHVTALAARKVLDASACGLEGVMNHQLKIGMRRLGLLVDRSSRFSIYWSPADCDGLTLDYNFPPRQGQVDANVDGFTLLVVTVWHLNSHAAPDDAVIESFQFFCLCVNPVFYHGGMFHVAKGDLQWKRHGVLP
jgi:hypothetical protein